jgi:hypothetical protein
VVRLTPRPKNTPTSGPQHRGDVRRADQDQAEQDVNGARAHEEQQAAVDDDGDDQDLEQIAPLRDQEFETVGHQLVAGSW